MMLEDVEEFAADAQLHLRSRGHPRANARARPDITKFHDGLATYKTDDENLVKLGRSAGKRRDSNSGRDR